VLVNAFFCLPLVKTLGNIKPENRTIHPSPVWLYVIPVFNLCWLFIIVFRMAFSIKNELLSRDYEVDANPGYQSGLTAAVLPFLIYLVYVTEFYITSLPYLSFVIGFLGIMRIIFFVQYWMKMSWYRKVMEEDAQGS